MPENSNSGARCAVVAILGAPNAGKSTFVNALVGEKISIVTHKVQTTRFPVRGVAMRGEAQLILVDTPGVFRPRRRLDRAMVRAAWAGAEDADVIVHIVDAAAEARARDGNAKAADRKSAEDAAAVAAGLKAADRRALLALNKIDLIPRDRLLALAEAFDAEGVYDAVFMIAAARGEGVDDVAEALVARAPLGPHLFPADQAADVPLRVMAAEITREKLYLRLHEELPYEATVETESWEERKDGSVKIDQIITVARDSQRKIALGKGGQAIKSIGKAAREELEKTLGRRVHLFLHVTVSEGWMDDRRRYDAYGLDFEA